MTLLRPYRTVLATISLAVSAVALAAPSSGLPAGKVELFLLAGQSNMAGRGPIKDLTAADAAENPRVWALNQEGDWQLAMDPLHWDKPGAAVGPGKFFGRVVAAKNPGVIVGLIPTACGGSSISVWAPGKFFNQTKSHPWDDAMVRAKRAMQDGTLKAILWHQGESDSNTRNAALYEKRLIELIVRFRTALDSPDLPFIIGQLGKFDSEGSTWSAEREEVDRAQQAVAAQLPHVYFVSAEGLGSRGDKLHFSTDSQKTLGVRFAEAYFKSQADTR